MAVNIVYCCDTRGVMCYLACCGAATLKHRYTALILTDASFNVRCVSVQQAARQQLVHVLASCNQITNLRVDQADQLLAITGNPILASGILADFAVGGAAA